MQDSIHKNNNEREKGKVFHETLVVAKAPARTVDFRGLSRSTAYLAESVIWFSLAVIEGLLVSRIVLVAFGALGDNLLSYLLYALSYPFIYFFNSETVQIPAKGAEYVPEIIAIMFLYFIIAYIFYKLVGLLKVNNNH